MIHQGCRVPVRETVRLPLPAFESEVEKLLFGWKKNSCINSPPPALSLKVANSLWLAGWTHGPPACFCTHAVVSVLKGFHPWTRSPRRGSTSGAGSATLPASFSSKHPAGLLLGPPSSRRRPSPPETLLFRARGRQRKRVFFFCFWVLFIYFISQEVMRQCRSVTGQGWGHFRYSCCLCIGV